MTLASTFIRHTGAMAADLQTASITVLSDTAAVGDRLMAILYCGDVSVTTGAADNTAFTLPAGWTITSLTSTIPTGDPRRLSGAIMVAEKTVTVAGIDASVFKWSCVQWRPMKLYKTWNQLTTGVTLTTHMQHTASLTTLRFTSIRGTKTQVLTRLANQRVVYPSASTDYAITGHVVRIGGIKQAAASGVLLAPAHTQRANFGPLRYGGFDNVPQTGVTTMNVSTRDITAVTSVAEATATARGDGIALTLLVAAVVKPQVSFVTPVTGASADLTVGFPITWTPPVEGTQQFVGIYRENPPGSGTNIQWWNGAAWQAGAVSVATSAQSATLPGFAATNGTAYRFLLAVYTSAAPDFSDYASIDITHRVTPTAPTITITPTPVSSVVASRVPTMAVSGTVTDGGSIVGWETQWTDSTGAIVLQSKSGPPASYPWVLTTPLDNNIAVHARARFSQAGGTQWSAWQDVPLTITVAKPAAPTVTFATILNPTSGLPVAQLTVTASSGTTVRVERGGVIVGEAVSTGSSIKLADLSAPSGPVTWSVTTLASTLYAERSNITTVNNSITTDKGWLFDPAHPETAVLMRVENMDPFVTDLRTSVFDPLGVTYPLIQPGVPGAARSAMSLRTDSPASVKAAEALLKSGATLMVRGWAELAPTAGARQDDITFQPFGEIQTGRVSVGAFSRRRVGFSYVVMPPALPGLAIVP